MVAKIESKPKGRPRSHAREYKARTSAAAQRASQDNRALIVLGMHRSGTSAVTRVCNLLGADLGSRLMASQPDNEAGFWEHQDVYLAHEDLLAELGSAWDDYRALPEGWPNNRAVAKARKRITAILKSEFADSGFWCVKDPRISRLVGLWLPVLEKLDRAPGFILVCRNPLEVAGSLASRNAFPAAKSQLLWLRHLIDAERDTRGRRRAFTTYEGLLRDWRRTMSQVAATLEMTWPLAVNKAGSEIDRFLKAQLRHQAVDDVVVESDRRLSRWIRDAYRAFKEAAEGDDAPLSEVLTSIAHELEAAAPLLEPWVRGLELDLAKASDEADRYNAEVKSLDAGRTAAQKAVAELQGEIERLRGELQGALERIEERTKEAARLSSDAVARQSESELLSSKLDAARANLEARLKDIEWLNSQLTTKQGEIEHLGAELATARANIADRQKDIAWLDGNLSARQGEVEHLSAELATAKVRAAEQDKEAGRLRSELAARQGQIEQLGVELEAVKTLSIERDTEFERLVSEFDRKQVEIERLESTLELARTDNVKRNREIASLAEQLASIEALAETRARLVTELQEAVATRDTNLAALGDRLSVQDKELAALRRENRDLVSERDGILRSTSWQITGPLRATKRGLLSLRRIPSLGRALFGWTARTIYHALPLGTERKLRLKNFVYRIFGFLIHNTATYQVWAQNHVAAVADTVGSGAPTASGASQSDRGPGVGNEVFLVQRAVAAAGEQNDREDSSHRPNTIGPTEILREIARRKVAPAEAKAYYDERAKTLFQGFLARKEALVIPSSTAPKVSIILILYNRAELTYLCLESLVQTVDLPAETIIVDNGSGDETGELLDRIEGARIIRNDDNLGFLKAVNQALSEARGDHVLLLNNDALMFPGALAAALRTLESEADIGAVGGRIVLLDGRLQEAGSIVWNDGSCFGYGRGETPDDPCFLFRRDVDYCSGAFLLVRRNLFVEIGGFDETFVPAYYEETDLCMCLRGRGYRVVYEPDAVVLHYEFGSSVSHDRIINLQKTNQEKFAAKHHDALSRHCAPDPRNVLMARSSDRNKPRFLLIDDRVPYRRLGSGFPRANDIVHCLVELGYFVTLYPMTVPDEDSANLYTELPREVEIVCGLGFRKLADFLKARPGYYGTIMISRPHNMKIFNQVYRNCPELFESVRVIYDAEAIFALRDAAKQKLLGETLPSETVDAMVCSEMALAERADTIVTVSAGEAAEFVKRGFSGVDVLGFQVDMRPGPSTFEQRHGILFVGAIHGDDTPNADSVLWFVNSVWPTLGPRLGGDACFIVAGTNKSQAIWALQGEKVQIRGFVEDLGALYDACRLFVAPTRYAGGIPYKAHEAAANGVPIVTTSLISQQLNWSDRKHLLVADTPESFAQRCLEAYRDKTVWQNLRQSALQKVESESSQASFRDGLATIMLQNEPPKAAVGDG